MAQPNNRTLARLWGITRDFMLTKVDCNPDQPPDNKIIVPMWVLIGLCVFGTWGVLGAVNSSMSNNGPGRPSSVTTQRLGTLRATEDGAAWIRASRAVKVALCTDIESRTGIPAVFLLDGLDAYYESPATRHNQIANIAGLIGAAGGY